jgi:hypothetical protein
MECKFTFNIFLFLALIKIWKFSIASDKNAATLLGSSKGKGKGKAVPLQAWTGPEGSRRLRLPDFRTVGTCRW